MCGIFGSVTKSISSDVFIEHANTYTKYRGPDESNILYEQFGTFKYIFGHNRLIITGNKDNGKQPIISDNKILIYNGEIFNFNNVKVNSVSDTEQLFDFLGTNFNSTQLNKLNGFFAFAIYYENSDSLYLVRDRYGEKPLYYKIIGENIFYSSSVRSFKNFDLGQMSKIKEVKGGGIKFDEINPMNGVSQIPPGHYLKFNKGVCEIRSWYNPVHKSFADINYSGAVDEFEKLFVDSVDLRIRDQDSVAVSLSGGIDSTLVAYTANQLYPDRIKGYTLATTYNKFNEVEAVTNNSKKIGINVKYICEREHTISDYMKCLEVLEFPSFNFSFVGYDDYYSNISRDGIRVIIEGHGPDEYMGGYAPMLYNHLCLQLLKLNIKDSIEVIKHLKRNYSLNNISVVKSLLNTYFSSFIKFKIPSGKKSNKQFFDKLSIPSVLRTFDRLSMLNNIETRSPFMDYRLVEFSQSLPEKYLFHKGKSKSILRTMLNERGFTDHDFGPKIGFTCNYDNLLKELFNDYEDSSKIRSTYHKKTFNIARNHMMSLFDC